MDRPLSLWRHKRAALSHPSARVRPFDVERRYPDRETGATLRGGAGGDAAAMGADEHGYNGEPDPRPASSDLAAAVEALEDAVDVLRCDARPSSQTLSRAQPSAVAVDTVTVPPGRRNFNALVSRFVTTCRSRVSSPPAASAGSAVNFAPGALCSRSVAAAQTTPARSTGWR